MIEDSYNANYTPDSINIRRFFERSNEIANSVENEVEWYNRITQTALNWLQL